MDKIALVTGGNRGLGFETCRQLSKLGYRVLLTSRDWGKGRTAAEALRAEGHQVDFQQLDVTKDDSIATVKTFIEKEYTRLDVLVNNAGVFLDSSRAGEFKETASLEIPAETVRKTFEINALGAYRLCQFFVPMMKKTRYGRIVNVSSGMGQLGEMEKGWPAYRISKTALNAVTRVFSEEVKGTGILVNSICPGWVKTDMGGPEADRSLEEGVDTIVWAATLPDDGPTGGFFRDRQPISW